MSKGWHEVARLGGTGARYPHILVDSHGWCLRMGTDTRRDEKYFSSLPNLLQGLVEHYARRRLVRSSPLASLEDLVSEVRDATRAALELCDEALQTGGLEEHIRRLGASKDTGTLPQSGIHFQAVAGASSPGSTAVRKTKTAS